MKTEYTITENDYVRAMKLHSRFTSKMTALFLVAATLLGAAAIYGSSLFRGAALGGLIGAVVVVVLGQYVLNPLLAKRHYKKYKAIQDPVQIALNDEGIEFSTADSNGMIRWKKFLKWRQNDDYLLVYLMPRMYYIIPKSIEASGFDLAALTSALEINVGPEK